MTRQDVRDNIIHYATLNAIMHMAQKPYEQGMREIPGFEAWPIQPGRARCEVDGQTLDIDSHLLGLLDNFERQVESGPLTESDIRELSALYDEYYSGTRNPSNPLHHGIMECLRTDWSAELERARMQIAAMDKRRDGYIGVQ